MNVILGASGQVGSAIIDFLLKHNVPVKGVIRNKEKADILRKKGAEVSIADYYDLSALKNAFQDADTLFLLTPEPVNSNDILGDTKKLLENYREAIKNSSVKKIIGLSSFGAQHSSGTGNLQMSYMLEHAFEYLPVQQIFIRPTYYYSNWLNYASTVKEEGVLPTFFPVDLKIPMISPIDVAEFIGEQILHNSGENRKFEITSPGEYSSKDVADAFGVIFNREVEARQIPEEQWAPMLQSIGFSDDAVKNFIEMTKAVIKGKSGAEGGSIRMVELKTELLDYLKSTLRVDY